MMALVRQAAVEYVATSGAVTSVRGVATDLVGSVAGFVTDNFVMVVVALVTTVIILGFTSARVR